MFEEILSRIGKGDEDLIIHKIFSGRPRDLQDVRTILLKNPDVNFQYIENWLNEFDLSMEGSDFLKKLKELRKT